MGWIDTELVLVSLAAMLSPTTLTFSVLVLVLSERPRRTGAWFLLGALSATLAIGVIAAFVLGDKAATSHPSSPKTWVAVLDIVFACLIIAWVARRARQPPDPKRSADAIAQMSRVSSSPAIAILGAGAALANPGAFIPIALKTISELDPSTTGYFVDWIFFSVVSVLPLLLATVALFVAPDWTGRVLARARDWLDRRARTVAFVILVLLAAALLRNGIAGLTS